MELGWGWGAWDEPFKKENPPSFLLLAKPSRREANLPGIISNCPAQFSAGLRIEEHTYPFCPGRSNHRTSAPHTNPKARKLARKLESHGHAHWHGPLSSGRSLAGCRAGLPPSPPPPPPAGEFPLQQSGCGPAQVQPVCRALGSDGEAGVTTQSDLPCWESRESVQPKPTRLAGAQPVGYFN